MKYWRLAWIPFCFIFYSHVNKLLSIYYSCFADQRRQAAKKDGCLCCIVHNNFKPDQTVKKSVLNVIFGKVGKILTYTIVQVSVLLLTVIFFAIGLWGMLSLTQVVWIKRKKEKSCSKLLIHIAFEPKNIKPLSFLMFQVYFQYYLT